MKRNKIGIIKALCVLLVLSLSLCSCGALSFLLGDQYSAPISLDEVPEYSGIAYVEINGNLPYFTEEEIVDDSYEEYGELDALGRCTVTIACIGEDLMPTEKREDLDHEPTGWQSVTYDCVNGKYLYNRCHLIGFQLTGENDNENNLITGTRYMNFDGMFPFEDAVADYLEDNDDNHVMYRVTPIFEGNDLVAQGVLMEAYSVEDDGAGVCFCVFVYNVQPGIVIDYATGNSAEDDGSVEFPENNDGANGDEDDGGNDGGATDTDNTASLMINTGTKKYHKTDCTYASGNNVEQTNKSREELEADGYAACKVCDP